MDERPLTRGDIRAVAPRLRGGRLFEARPSGRAPQGDGESESIAAAVGISGASRVDATRAVKLGHDDYYDAFTASGR